MKKSVNINIEEGLDNPPVDDNPALNVETDPKLPADNIEVPPFTIPVLEVKKGGMTFKVDDEEYMLHGSIRYYDGNGVFEPSFQASRLNAKTGKWEKLPVNDYFVHEANFKNSPQVQFKQLDV